MPIASFARIMRHAASVNSETSNALSAQRAGAHMVRIPKKRMPARITSPVIVSPILVNVTILEFTPIVFLVSLLAGFLGAMTGLGGGAIVTPALTLMLGVDIRYAIGASVVSVIATSSGAAAAFVREGYTKIRIGMALEVATTLGALLGAFLATRIPTSVLAIIFGLVLLHAAWNSTRKPPADPREHGADRLAQMLRL